jgi:hypothetical protein
MFSQFFLSSFTEAQKQIRLSMPKTNRNTNKQLIVTEKWKTFATYKYCVYPDAVILCSKLLRFSDAWELHTVVDPMKDSNYDIIVIPEKIRKNSSWSGTRNIPGWHGNNVRQYNELLHQCDVIHVFAGKGSRLRRALELDLEELIIPEQYLIVLERVYGTVLKLSGNPKWRKSSHFHWAYYNVESERDHAAVGGQKDTLRTWAE